MPVPLCGTGGSITVDALIEILDYARRVVPAPPLAETTTWRAERWVEDVRAALDYRRELLQVVREARAPLREEHRTRRMLDDELATLRRQERAEQERRDGTYWSRRESGRTSQRPARIRVGPDEWRRFTARSRRAGITVGEAVGALVRDHDARSIPEDLVGLQSTAQLRSLYIRIAVEPDEWQRFGSLCSAGLGRARTLGRLVEAAVRGRTDRRMAVEHRPVPVRQAHWRRSSAEVREGAAVATA